MEIQMVLSSMTMNLTTRSTPPSTQCWIRSTPIWMTWKNETMPLMANCTNCWSQTGKPVWISGPSCLARQPRRKAVTRRSTRLQRRNPSRPAKKTLMRKTEIHKLATKACRAGV